MFESISSFQQHTTNNTDIKLRMKKKERKYKKVSLTLEQEEENYQAKN
jgi:hypothetical protein